MEYLQRYYNLVNSTYPLDCNKEAHLKGWTIKVCILKKRTSMEREISPVFPEEITWSAIHLSGLSIPVEGITIKGRLKKQRTLLRPLTVIP